MNAYTSKVGHTVQTQTCSIGREPLKNSRTFQIQLALNQLPEGMVDLLAAYPANSYTGPVP